MTPQDACATLRKLCSYAPVIPVLTVEDPDTAQPLAEALVAGGLPILEVTLRTPDALNAIDIMDKVPGCIVGAGTLMSPENAKAAKQAGAQFGVSPGATPKLLDACEQQDLPLLPGAATASELMTLLERGYTMAKFFPAGAIGGTAVLKSFSAPMPQMTLCPTGGISMANVSDYLALPNVICVGGSWVAPAKLVAESKWDEIESLAREASRVSIS